LRRATAVGVYAISQRICHAYSQKSKKKNPQTISLLMQILRRIKSFVDDIETKSFILFYVSCKIRFRFYGEESIKNYQEKRVRKIVRYAMEHSRFFREYYSSSNTNDIWNLPTVNKKVMMENLTDYNTVGLTKDEIINFCLETEKTRDFSKRLRGLNVGMSSGTSGNKGVEIVSAEEERYMKATLFSRFDFSKGEKINLAFILRVSAPAFSLGKFGHKLTYISQLDSIDNILKRLVELQPNMISAPPSMLKLLAKEKEKNNLPIKPIRLVSYAEVLYPDVKKYLEQVFRCPVREIYKCTEGPIAVSCRFGSLHINEDLVFVETLNENNTQTPAGKPCKKLIVTDLHKKSQPIIRYELNDIITIAKDKCRCGSNFRVIEKIQGRADDMFWGIRKDDRSKHFICQDYISRAIISVSDEIEEHQAIQKDYDSVVLRIKMKEGAGQEDIPARLIEGVKGVFSKYDCVEPEVDVLFADPLPNKFSNKLARIICEIKDK